MQWTLRCEDFVVVSRLRADVATLAARGFIVLVNAVSYADVGLTGYLRVQPLWATNSNMSASGRRRAQMWTATL